MRPGWLSQPGPGRVLSKGWTAIFCARSRQVPVPCPGVVWPPGRRGPGRASAGPPAGEPQLPGTAGAPSALRTGRLGRAREPAGGDPGRAKTRRDDDGTTARPLFPGLGRAGREGHLVRKTRSGPTAPQEAAVSVFSGGSPGNASGRLGVSVVQ